MIVATALEAEELLRPCFAEGGGERLAVAHLASDGRLIELVTMPGGAADSVELPLRAIFADALRLGATALLVAHNHPSGDPEPSRADLEATRRLAATGASLGVALRDHLIFGGGRTCSLRALGLI